MSDNNNKSTPSTGTTTNTKKVLQDLKRDQEEFYRRISEIARSDIAASPPYHEQFERILQKSAKRILEIDNELKMLDDTTEHKQQADQEEERNLIKLRDTGDDNEMLAVKMEEEVKEEEANEQQQKQREHNKQA